MQATLGIRLALPDRRNQLLAMVGVLLGLAVYFSASVWLGWDLPRASVLIGAAAAFIVTLRWRWGVTAVLVYVTVEGLVGNLLYPEIFPVLLKDGLITGAYLGFAASLVAQRHALMVTASVLRPFVALVALCVVGSFNPAGYDPFVALVGFRVLVFYIPLFALGLHLSRTGVTADRLAVFVLLASIPITVFGIAEYLAGPDAVASLGPGFARTVWIVGPESTADLIFRPASTFAFVGHFGAYLLFIGVVGFAALHMPTSTSRRVLYATAFALTSIAIILQSQRTAWVLLPVAVLAIYLLSGRLRGAVRAAPVLAVAVALALAVGTPVLENRLPGLTTNLEPYVNHLLPIVWSFGSNLSPSDILIGHGTGTALGAARYVTGGDIPGQFESGWFQPFYMFGIWGLLAYLWLYSAVLRAAWPGVRSLPAERRWLSTGLFVFLLLTAVVSGPINYPPTNVFFWLFAGLLAGQAGLLPGNPVPIVKQGRKHPARKAPAVDLLLGSDIGLWVAQVVEPADVRQVLTFDETIASAASGRGMRVGTDLQEGHRALSVHYPRVLSASELDMYEAIYNLHPGYLPWGRGHFPLVWAIWLEEPAGATLHRMVPRLDIGPIVDQRRVDVRDDETGYSLFLRIREVERSMFTEWWPSLISYRSISERKQIGVGSYHDRSSFESLLATDPTQLSRAEVDRLSRALTFPGKPGLVSKEDRPWPLAIQQCRHDHA